MEKDNLAFLRLILDSVRKINEYVSGMDLTLFSKDGKTQSAVIMQLQVMGELVKKIPENTKSEINLPWGKIVGMRDMVSHDYFSLDIEAVWLTVKRDIPEVEKEISRFLNK